MLKHPFSIFMAHHGSPEAKGLELVQVLPPVLRAVVRHEEDSFSQLSKPVVFIPTHYLDVNWIKITEVCHDIVAKNVGRTKAASYFDTKK
jgi:hypothetical protein